MGWDYCHNTTRERLVKELTDPYKNDNGVSVRTICCADHGATIWVLRHITKSDGSIMKLIVCNLIKGGGKSWGHYSMDEYMGPYYWDCPIKMLELAGEDDQWQKQFGKGDATRKWRHAVREWHSANAHHSKTHGYDQVVMFDEEGNMPQRLFIGIFPGGIVYCDRFVQEHNDYRKIAFLDYATLELKLYDPPAELLERIKADAAAIQAKRGERFETSTTGQSVILGSKID